MFLKGEKSRKRNTLERKKKTTEIRLLFWLEEAWGGIGTREIEGVFIID